MFRVACTLITIFLFKSGPVYGQQVDTLNLNFGLGLVEGHSKIDTVSPLYRAPIIIAEANASSPTTRTRNRFSLGHDQFGGKSSDLSVETMILKVSMVRVGVGARYLYAKDKDLIWNYDKMLVTGWTRKQYLLMGFNAGAGDYRHKNLRLYFLFGGTEMLNNIFVYYDKKLSDEQPTLIDRDYMTAFAASGSVVWPDVLEKIDVYFSASNIQTLDYLKRTNRKEIIPKKQWLIEAELKRPIMSWLDAGVDLKWNNYENGMIHLGSSGAIKAVFKFKTP